MMMRIRRKVMGGGVGRVLVFYFLVVSLGVV